MRLLCTLLVVAPLSAHAASATITLDTAGTDYAQQMGLTADELIAQMEAELDTAFNLLEPEEYVRALADAQAFSNKGLGVDYASNPTAFSGGIAGNFALALGDEGLGERYEERPVVGATFNGSIMLGFNLGFAGLDWLTVYGNYFYQNVKMDEYDGNLMNWGVHGQIKLFRPEGDAMELLFQWGGFDITSGVAFSRLFLELQKPLETPIPLGGGIQARYNGVGTYDVTTTAFTIPIELTTNFRIFYALTIFVGAGIDVQLGSGEMKVSLDGDLTAPNPLGGEDINLGRAAIEVSEEGKPSPGRPRLMAGLQVNIWAVKIFAQINAIPPEAGFSAGGGVRIAW